MFETQTVLILIALASAIVGTVWTARPWAKVLIVLLALATAGTAIFESQRKATDERDAKERAAAAQRNLELLIRAIQPPAIFDDAVLDGYRTIAEERGLHVSGQSVREDGGRVFEFGPPDGEDKVLGLIFLSKEERQSLFLDFANGKDLNPSLSATAYGTWGDDDLVTDWNIFTMKVYQLARHTLGKDAHEDTVFTGYFDAESRSVVVSVTLPDGQDAGAVLFEADFITSLTRVLPIERGRMIHEYTAAQIIH